MLTGAQLTKLAEWNSVEPGFDRLSRTEADIIFPLIESLASMAGLALRVFTEVGMSTYYSLFVYDVTKYPVMSDEPEEWVHRYEGICIWLSLLGPFAACARAFFHDARPKLQVVHVSGSHPWVDPTAAISLPDPADPIEQAILAAISRTPYRLLSKEELAQPLPPGVRPIEYVPGNVPPYLAYHAIFQDAT